MDAAASGALVGSQGGFGRERLKARRTNGAVTGFANVLADVHGPQDLLAKAIRGRQNRVVLAPVAGVKSAEVLVSRTGSDQATQFADDGDKTNSSPGRARHKP